VWHPKTGQPVREFEVMHERLMHAFVISVDLLDFAHDHPRSVPTAPSRSR
jgi:hypothetical protein